MHEEEETILAGITRRRIIWRRRGIHSRYYRASDKPKSPLLLPSRDFYGRGRPASVVAGLAYKGRASSYCRRMRVARECNRGGPRENFVGVAGDLAQISCGGATWTHSRLCLPSGGGCRHSKGA